MPSYCERCGRALQDGEVCNCAPVQQPAPQADYAAPQAGQPVYQPEVQQPPAYDPMAAQPQPGQPPYQAQPGQPYPPQQPGQAPGYPPQAGQPYQPPGPSQAQQVQQQAKQALGEFTNVLGGFAKDPVGAAGKVLSPVTALIFLLIQVIVYPLYDLVRSTRFVSDIYGSFASSSYSFGTFMLTLLYVLINVAIMFGCLYLMSLITKLQLDPMKMLSAIATASIPVTACYVVMLLLTLIFGTLNSFGNFLVSVVSAFGTAAGICLLEIGLRSQMPQGQGNVARLLTIAVSYAVTIGIGAVLYSSMLGSSASASDFSWLW